MLKAARERSTTLPVAVVLSLERKDLWEIRTITDFLQTDALLRQISS